MQDDHAGNCEAELANKTAIISIAHPRWSETVTTNFDVEVAVVHELMHLLGWGLQPGEKVKSDLFDHMIDVAAEELVRQRRRLSPKP